ncbi:hypothetical protein FACS189416_3760 [Bacteroidia bacterium]|nr:hypothetical protein FACS189416_3760 [Bacteroidia bacterium]
MDYRVVMSPSEKFCSTDLRKSFRTIARCVINIEEYEGNLDVPRWTFIKSGEYILWGIGCNNKVLSQEYYTDETGTPIRGFFGIIFKAINRDTIILPFSIGYFQNLYQQIFPNYWTIRSGNIPLIDIDYGDLSNFETIKPEINSDILNRKENICRLFASTVDLKILFSSALGFPNDISIISGLNERKHAVQGGFMNAVVEECKQTENIILNVKQNICNKCSKQSSNLLGGICSECRNEVIKKNVSVIKGKDDIKQKNNKRERPQTGQRILYGFENATQISKPNDEPLDIKSEEEILTSLLDKIIRGIECVASRFGLNIEDVLEAISQKLKRKKLATNQFPEVEDDLSNKENEIVSEIILEEQPMSNKSNNNLSMEKIDD